MKHRLTMNHKRNCVEAMGLFLRYSSDENKKNLILDQIFDSIEGCHLMISLLNYDRFDQVSKFQQNIFFRLLFDVKSKGDTLSPTTLAKKKFEKKKGRID